MYPFMRPCKLLVESPLTHLSQADLVDEVGQQAFNFVHINSCPGCCMSTNPQGSCELYNWNTGSPDGRLSILRLFESTCDEDFAEQVAQRNISPALER